MTASDEAIAGLTIPTGIPLVYELDEATLAPVEQGGTYLDPEPAKDAVAAVPRWVGAVHPRPTRPGSRR